MTEPAGTPEVTSGEKPEVSEKVEVSKQFKDEALVWKGKAEQFNQLERKTQEQDTELERLRRLAYSGGQAATDPTADIIAQLREQAQFDPVARGTLMNMEMTARAQAEAWLSQQLLNVPENKRSQVAGLIRNSNYQMSKDDAMNLVTDPDTKNREQKMAELEEENKRLKNTRPNGVSPSSITPANSGLDMSDAMPYSEYSAVMKQGGPAAMALRQKVDTKQVRLDYRR